MTKNKTNKTKLVVYWARRDFRLIDNPAMSQAIKKANDENLTVLPIFILDPYILSPDSASVLGISTAHQSVGYPRKKMLSKILSDFKKSLPELKILVGDPSQIFEILVDNYQVELFVNEDIENYARVRDYKIQELILQKGGNFFSYLDQLSVDRNTKAGGGNLYSVFTPFKKNVWESFVKLESVGMVDSQTIQKTEFLGDSKLEDLIRDSTKTENSTSINSGFNTDNNPKSDIFLIKTEQSEEASLEKKIFELIDSPWVFFPDYTKSASKSSYKTSVDISLSSSLRDSSGQPNSQQGFQQASLDFGSSSENNSETGFEQDSNSNQKSGIDPLLVSQTSDSQVEGSETQNFEINLDEIFFRQAYDSVISNEIQAIVYFLGYLKSGKMDTYKKNRDDLGLDLELWESFISFDDMLALGYHKSEIISFTKSFGSGDTTEEQRPVFEILENGVKLQASGQTSMMSTPLKWGLITPRILVRLMKEHYQDEFKNPFGSKESPSHYISELIWREFYRYIQYHFPETQNIEFQTKFRDLDLESEVDRDIFVDTANSIIKKLS